MISQDDIAKAFGEVRNQLRETHIQDNGRKEGKAKEDAERLYNLFLIGLFVGESLVTDIKRIADGLNEIAINTQPRG